MFGEPQPTQADLHFNVAGFPVRVSPWFWAIALLIGLNSFGGEVIGTLTSVAVVFVSILVHELGHAVMQRKFGGRPHIVLHGMGGLAICGDCDRSPRSQVIICLAGPIAGFLLAALTMVGVWLTSDYMAFVPMGSEWSDSALELRDAGELDGTGLMIGTFLFGAYPSLPLNDLVIMLMFVNVVWGLMNLLPIYPLDGGQIAREFFTLGQNPQQGVIRSLQLSIGVAAVVAAWMLLGRGQLYTALLFGFLAYSNYRTLQAYTGRGPGYGW